MAPEGKTGLASTWIPQGPTLATPQGRSATVDQFAPLAGRALCIQDADTAGSDICAPDRARTDDRVSLESDDTGWIDDERAAVHVVERAVWACPSARNGRSDSASWSRRRARPGCGRSGGRPLREQRANLLTALRLGGRSVGRGIWQRAVDEARESPLFRGSTGSRRAVCPQRGGHGSRRGSRRSWSARRRSSVLDVGTFVVDRRSRTVEVLACLGEPPASLPAVCLNVLDSGVRHALSFAVSSGLRRAASAGRRACS